MRQEEMVMKNVVILMICSMMLLAITSCKGLKTGVGIRGIVCGEDLMTLDGDTFNVQERISDSILIVRHYKEYNAPCYLIKQERNGFYYVQHKGNTISTINNTQDYVCVDDKMVYNLKDKTSFSLPCDASYLYYLGQWKGKVAFTNQDSICFSDGKCIALQENAFCKTTAKEGDVVLGIGARRIQVPIEKLYQHKSNPILPERDVIRFTKDYFIQPHNQHESVDAGFDVDLDIPIGNRDCDKAIREWMISSIKNDAFSLLGCNKDIFMDNSDNVQDMISSLDTYGALWEKLYRNDYQVEDTLVLRMICNIRSRKIIDCDDYTTYYYWSSIYDGGLHEMPKSYYITFDKRQQRFLTTSNIVKHSMMKLFREEALKSIKPLYDENFRRTCDWDDFLQAVFSFHSPMYGESGTDEALYMYVCDEWSGWGYTDEKPFTLDNFPLPHLAILPEGVVLTYHPYQIDCFASGEYNVIIPFDKVSKCLQYEYHHCTDELPKLEQFVK